MTQRIKSQYGRQGITVSDSCPTNAIRRMLGKTHVSTRPGLVEDMVRDAAAGQRAGGNDGWTVEAEEEAVRYALWQHDENRAEYGWVMGSH